MVAAHLLRSATLAWLAVTLGACASGPDVPSAAFGRRAEPPEAGAATATPTDAAADTDTAGKPAIQDADAPQPSARDDRERALRALLATAADPTGAALELAELLTAREAPDEALAVVESALARRQSASLRVARVDLLRDLGQRHLAVAELRTVVTDLTVPATPPDLLFDLAELEWLEGNRAAARTALDALVAQHAATDWFLANKRQVTSLRDEVATAAMPRRIRVRDLFGNLRGAPSAVTRVKTLEGLVGDPSATSSAASSPASSAAAEPGRAARAVAIALGDESPAVRTRAVQLAAPEPDVASAFCAAALVDPSPLVRRAAVVRTEELLGAAAVPVLLTALATEADPACFRALHEALGRRTALDRTIDLDDPADPAQRQATLEAWRAACSP